MKKQSLIIFIAKNNERRTAVITISILANFLNINSSDVEEFNVAITDNGNVILIKLKKKECCCPYCRSSSLLDSMINNKEIIKLNEFIPVIQLLSNWNEWIANSFIVVDGRRLSNGPIEGFNSNFKKMMTVSNGLYSFQRFRNRLMYCYNKPNILSPVKERISKRPRKKRGPYKKARNITNPS